MDYELFEQWFLSRMEADIFAYRNQEESLQARWPYVVFQEDGDLDVMRSTLLSTAYLAWQEGRKSGV